MVKRALAPVPRTNVESILSKLDALRLRRYFRALERFCLFVGYPRSGHSLAGSLLNAHPNLVIAHELNVFRYLERGYSRGQLFAKLLEKDRRFTAAGSIQTGYSYAVPGQWQGRFTRLRVIGDKKGGLASRQIREDPTLLSRLRDRVRLPLGIVHIVRNPFDNIATMYTREAKFFKRGPDDLSWYVTRYFEHCEGSTIALAYSSESEALTVRQEDLIAQPKAVLTQMCAFFGCDAPEEYLDACAAVVLPSPRRTRGDAPWTDSLIEAVNSGIARYPFLNDYRYDA